MKSIKYLIIGKIYKNKLEAVLKSRPRYTLSNCAEAVDILTPAQLLIESAMIGAPELNIDKIIGWKSRQKIKFHLWKCWLTDYFTRRYE